MRWFVIVSFNYKHVCCRPCDTAGIIGAQLKLQVLTCDLVRGKLVYAKSARFAHTFGKSREEREFQGSTM